MQAAIARQQQPGWQKSQSKRLKKDKAELRARLHSEYDEQARTKQVPCTAPTQGYSPTPCLTVYVFFVRALPQDCVHGDSRTATLPFVSRRNSISRKKISS